MRRQILGAPSGASPNDQLNSHIQFRGNLTMFDKDHDTKKDRSRTAEVLATKYRRSLRLPCTAGGKLNVCQIRWKLVMHMAVPNDCIRITNHIWASKWPYSGASRLILELQPDAPLISTDSRSKGYNNLRWAYLAWSILAGVIPLPVGALREFATGFDWALALNRILRLAGPLSITVGPKSTG